MKKFYLTILFLLLAANVWSRTGTVVSSGVTVGDPANTFSAAYCDEIQGCPQTVADIPSRDAISAARRVVGMTAYVVSEDKIYRLIGAIDNGSWVEVVSAGAGQWVVAGTAVSLAVDSNNVGIGTASPPDKLYVVGNITSTGTGNFGGGDEALIGTRAKIDLNNGTPGVVTMASRNNSNNEDMNFDLESASNTVTFGSSTGITKYVVPQTLKVNRLMAGGADISSVWDTSDGIVSFYKMEDSLNDMTVTDNQGNNLCTSDTNTENIATAGKINLGFTLNSGSSTTHYIDCGGNASIKPTGDMSINFWLKTTSSSTLRMMGNRGATGTNVGSDILIIGGKLEVILDSGSVSSGLVSTTSINTGAWFMGTLTRSGSNIILYVNGAIEDSDILAGDIGTGASNFYIGRTPLTATYFIGTLDNPAIYNRALTGAEILQLYAGSVGTDLLSGGGTALNTQIIGTSTAIVSNHGLNNLKDLVVEGATETQTGLYVDGGVMKKDLAGGTYTECWSQDGVMACTVDADGIIDGQ